LLAGFIIGMVGTLLPRPVESSCPRMGFTDGRELGISSVYLWCGPHLALILLWGMGGVV
jgi:hypothetical protein